MPEREIEEIDALLKAHQIAKWGVADLEPFKAEGAAVPEALLNPYTSAVSMAVEVDRAVIDGALPCNAYAHAYWKLNDILNRAAFALSLLIENKGFRAKPIPASYLADEKRLMGNISHKAVARMAGLGWQGRSLLLVTPEYGPRVRLVSVLTDMPLEPAHQMKTRCGECTKCAEACPVRAIKGGPPKDRYIARDEAIDLGACYSRTLVNKAQPEIGALICGLCMQVCPWGKPKRDE